MYQSFIIKNYRCFTDLEIEPLKQVNLIAGKNNVGKTALLEALLIYHSVNPGFMFTVEHSRGLENIRKDEFFSDLFTEFDLDRPIILSDGNATLEIISQEHSVSRIFPDKEFPGTDSEREILFRYPGHSDEIPRELHTFFEGDNIRFDRPRGPGNRNTVFLPARARENSQKLADRLSDLKEKKKYDRIIETLRIIEDRLQNLEVLSKGSRNIIYGDIGISRLIGMPLMGEGMGRLLEIALTMTDAQGGILLIDEIENGFHYTIMSKVWGAIADLAQEYNAQVFATTHSWGCIETAHKAFCGRKEYDFRFHRLQRTGNSINAVTLDQDALQTTIEEGWEIR